MGIFAYKMAFLRVLPTRWRRERFAYKMSAWEFCLQNGGVSESFSHKMAAWEICLQDGGNAAFLSVLPTRCRRGKFAYKTAAFLRFTHKMAAWEFCLQDGGVSESLPTRWRRERFAYKMAAMPR